MSALIYLIPVALTLGVLGLGAFLWSLKSGQYDDLDGAAQRILLEDDDKPRRDPPKRGVPREKTKNVEAKRRA
ncbi:cbb3-type cytochrome oxidase assembly protein CcoS [Afifella sp. IM 167]|nr:cbb3-type cytochrome oxidase assembly protein CcoS [Afifella sp. IM 167]